MDDLISVIVPVYNVDIYLEKSLLSLLNQTYKNLQIILIDDGSTDDSARICDHYKRIDKRIEVFHLKNQGVSNARNLGLDYAKGKYIYFFDSDDTLEPEALRVLYDELQNNDIDLVECSYFKVYSNQKKAVIHPEIKIKSKEAIRDLLLWRGCLTSFCWDKLYIKDKIGTLRFDTSLKIGEDDLFVFEYLLKCDNVIVIERPLYNYLIRENSAIGSVYTSGKIDSVRAAAKIHKICKNRNLMVYESEIHVGCAAFFSYANLLNTVPYTKMNELKSDCEFYVGYMGECSFRKLCKSVGTKMVILYKTAQYCPLLYKASGCIRKRRR